MRKSKKIDGRATNSMDSNYTTSKEMGSKSKGKWLVKETNEN